MFVKMVQACIKVSTCKAVSAKKRKMRVELELLLLKAILFHTLFVGSFINKKISHFFNIMPRMTGQEQARALGMSK